MRIALGILFGFILVAMLAITTYASLDRSVWNVGRPLLTDRWFQATLLDAYFGFLTFYVWVAYRETTWAGRIGWLVAILLLGNIAMSVYVLLRLLRLEPGDGWRELLLRPAEARPSPTD